MQRAKIIAFTALAAICYGIVHDQITARICVEYFTLAHPPLFHTTSPAALGFCWGIAATIGIGAVLGAVLAAAACTGDAPPWPMARIARSIGALLGAMAVCAALAGLLGCELSLHGLLRLPEPLAEIIHPARRDRFMAVWFAHIASYAIGLAGGAFVIHRVWRERGRPRILSAVPRTKGAAIRALLLVALAILIIYLRFFRL